MKQELLEIIEHELTDSTFKKSILQYCSQIIDYYENNRPETVEKFRKLLGKYNFLTLNDFSEFPECPQVALFKSIDEFTFYPVIDSEEGVSNVDEEIGVIISQAKASIEDNPESGEAEDFLNEMTWIFHLKIVMTWLASIWQEINGYKSGIIVKTLENNSVSQFIFNDLAWNDLSSHFGFNDNKAFIERHFNCDLSVFEIYQRVSDFDYPINPYVNKWRQFSDGKDWKEIVLYGHETGERIYADHAEKPALNLIQHSSLSAAMKYVQSTSKKWIETGYREKQLSRPNKEVIYEGAIETDFHSGINYYPKELKNRLTIDKVKLFEQNFNIQLPFHFKHYLRLFNGRKYNQYKMKFRINENLHLQVKDFFNLEELRAILNEAIKIKKSNWQQFFSSMKNKAPISELSWLDIGTLEKGGLLCLNVDLKSKDYGGLAIKKDTGEYENLNIQFSKFIAKAKY